MDSWFFPGDFKGLDGLIQAKMNYEVTYANYYVGSGQGYTFPERAWIHSSWIQSSYLIWDCSAQLQLLLFSEWVAFLKVTYAYHLWL